MQYCVLSNQAVQWAIKKNSAQIQHSLKRLVTSLSLIREAFHAVAHSVQSHI